MASTKEMQARARAKKQADALMAKLTQPNTTSWVDEGYSKLLAAQLYQKLQAAAGNTSRTKTLQRIRTDFSYVCEEPIVSGTRVWFLDNSMTRPGQVIISYLDYDLMGKVKNYLTYKNPIYVSKHGLERVYQRLRSNSRTDAVALLKQLTILDEPVAGQELTLEVEGGRFHLVADRMPLDWPDAPDEQPVVLHVNPDTPQYKQIVTTVGEVRKHKGNSKPFWVVKTYIGNKPE